MGDDTSRPVTLMGLPSYLAGHVSRIGHRTLVEELASRDLRLPHFAVLAGLHDLGPTAQHELADRLRLNRSHLVGYLDDLERAGLITRSRDPDDRRRQRVELQTAGHRLCVQLIESARTSEAVNLAVLSDAELATLTTLLHKIVAADDADDIDRSGCASSADGSTEHRSP